MKKKSRILISLSFLFVFIFSAPITRANVPDNSVTSSSITDYAISAADIGYNSINSARLMDATIQSIDIKDYGVSIADIAFDAINSARIVDNTIVSLDIKDGEVKSPDIGYHTILGSNIGDSTIGPRSIKSGMRENSFSMYIGDIAASPGSTFEIPIWMPQYAYVAVDTYMVFSTSNSISSGANKGTLTIERKSTMLPPLTAGILSQRSISGSSFTAYARNLIGDSVPGDYTRIIGPADVITLKYVQGSSGQALNGLTISFDWNYCVSTLCGSEFSY